MMKMAEKIVECRDAAEKSLDATGRYNDEPKSAIGDLIQDLMHLAEANGVSRDGMHDWVNAKIDDYLYESDPFNADELV